MEKNKKRLKIKSFRTKLTIFAVIAVMLNVIVLSAFMCINVYNQMKSSQTTTVNETLKNYTTYLDQFFSQNEASLNELSQNYEMKNILSNPTEYAPKIQALFKNFQDARPNIKLISYGTETGQYYFDPPRNKVPEGYDPRKRPWYILAKETDKIAYTTVYADIATGKNIITIVKKITNDKNEMVGVLGIILELDTLVKINNEIKIGQKGYTFLTQGENFLVHNNKELVNKKIEDKKILDPSVAKASSEFSSSYVENAKKETKFIKYAYYPRTGWTIWSVGYESDLLAPINKILYTILYVAILILILTVIAAVLISKIMVKNVHKILESTNILSSGDMTQELVLRSGDEFQLLAEGVDSAREKTRNLIENVKNLTDKVMNTASSLVSVSEQTASSAEEVSEAIGHIAIGSTEQVSETEKISQSVEKFSQQIDAMTEDFCFANETVIKIRTQVSDGVNNMSVLNIRANENIKSTSDIEDMVNNLASNIENIDDILQAINSISEQTNLLALNASIEAARAGEAGRGFSVVADEIRKLAESSASFTQKIKEITDMIKLESINTVSSMGDLKQSAIDQTDAVKNSTNTFNSITDSIKEIERRVNLALTNVKIIDADKDKIIAAISSITAAAAEAAASTEEVSASAEEQTASSSLVSSSAIDLQSYVEDLRKLLDCFKI